MFIHYLEQRFFKKKQDHHIIETLLIDLSAVFLWRGTWGLMDAYFFPSSPELSFIASLLVGGVLIFAIRASSRD